jgi:hypothetical protein
VTFAEFCLGLWDYAVDEVHDCGWWTWTERRLSSKSVKDAVTKKHEPKKEEVLN